MIATRVLVALCTLFLARAAGAEVVSRALRARADAEGSVAVVVALRAPAPRAVARGEPARRAAIALVREAVLGALAPGDIEVEHAYATLPGFAGRATAAGLERLAASPDVLRVDLDPIGRGAAAGGGGIAQIRADRVQGRGVTGIGTTIAVIDTGVEANHPDIIDALVGEECFCRAGPIANGRRSACCPDGTARESGPGSAAAAHPHGVHVAGVAVSRGRVAPAGVAPGALLVAVRVLDENNFGFVSDWIAALDWLLAERPDVRVVNMSVITTQLYAGDCGRCRDEPGCAATRLLADAIEQLWRRGTLVFAASGNDSRARAMTAPACVARALAVGAVNAQDAVEPFSNTSPQLDLLAPGFDIVSDGFGGQSAVMSGTSVASPHAAGAAALILSARPGLGAAAVEQLLLSTGVTVTDARTERAAPRVDAFAALHAATRGPELERGSGSRGTDCLLEWNFVPPEIVRRHGWPLAECRDNDPLCDADDELGRCTFVYSPCFNMHDPLLRQCAVNEPLRSFAVSSPPVDAPSGTLERINVDYLASALPDFPFAGSDTCGARVPFIVARRAGAAGIGHLRMAVATDTRRDYDHLVLRCLPP
jgi:subtilisin family serine protease